MSNYVVWIDSETAHVFALKTTGIEKSVLRKHAADHHTHSKKDHHSATELDPFFKTLTAKLGHFDQLLILGPSLAKKHFKTYLETHHADVAKHVIGVESADHPSDDGILAIARKFYKNYDLFHNPIQE